MSINLLLRVARPGVKLPLADHVVRSSGPLPTKPELAMLRAPSSARLCSQRGAASSPNRTPPRKGTGGRPQIVKKDVVEPYLTAKLLPLPPNP